MWIKVINKSELNSYSKHENSNNENDFGMKIEEREEHL
jgi:hypothetical protein